MDVGAIKDRVMDLGPVDLTAILVLLVFLVRGVLKGFVWQVAGLAAVVAGLVAASSFARFVAPKLRSAFPSLTEESGLDMVVSYFVVFLAVVCVVALIGRVMKGLIDRLHLTSFDRVLGGLFGLAKAAVILVVLVSFLSWTLPLKWQEEVAQAYTGRWSEVAIRKSGPLFSDEVKREVEEAMAKVRQSLPEDMGGTRARDQGGP